MNRAGAYLEGDGVRFTVWAPGKTRVELVVHDDEPYRLDLNAAEDGYWTLHVPGLEAGTRYQYVVDDHGPFPDMASRFQPDGVHGPSEVLDLSRYAWTDARWRTPPIEDLVIYELHVGTFTPEGTYAAIIDRLEYLADLGVTAIELMPIADFPGDRNWGYDGVSLYAPSRAYGRPEDLQRLVDAAHARGLAVLLDVVYNHLGPDGNYLWSYTNEYFTPHHHTPWGDALNYDGEHSGPVREYFIGNAVHWLEDYHIDGLRLDATDQILDDGERHLLHDMAERVRERFGGTRVLIAEDHRNEARIVAAPSEGGYGLAGVWADDFHHQVRRALGEPAEGYYVEYTGAAADLARTIERGWFFEGQPTRRTGKPRGTNADVVLLPACVHCIQNHDQIGNRAFGERLNHLVTPAEYRAASALLLLDPATPLLFMGQEWAASSPFLFFTDHHDELGRAVTEGRRSEFRHFAAFADEDRRHQIPDPQAVSTFERSRLNWPEVNRDAHAATLRLYQDLLRLRRTHPALLERSRGSVRASAAGDHAVVVRRDGGGRTLLLVAGLRGTNRVPLDAGRPWRALLSTEDARYGGQDTAFVDGDEVVLRGPGAVVLEVVH